MSFDNFTVDVLGDDDAVLKRAVALAFDGSDTPSAVAWKVDPKYGLMFLWSAGDGATLFPVGLNAEGAAAMASLWLKSLSFTDFPKQPDIDGSIERGFRVYKNDCQTGRPAAICSVAPAWAIYHK